MNSTSLLSGSALLGHRSPRFAAQQTAGTNQTKAAKLAKYFGDAANERCRQDAIASLSFFGAIVFTFAAFLGLIAHHDHQRKQAASPAIEAKVQVDGNNVKDSKLTNQP